MNRVAGITSPDLVYPRMLHGLFVKKEKSGELENATSIHIPFLSILLCTEQMLHVCTLYMHTV